MLSKDAVKNVRKNRFMKVMLNPETEEERSQRFWTGASLVQGGSFLLLGGSAGLILPGMISVGIAVKIGFDTLRQAANSDKDSLSRRISRRTLRMILGVEGSKNSQLRRRVSDFVITLGIAVAIGGASVTALLTGLAAGAAITLISTWERGADPEWEESSKEESFVEMGRNLLNGVREKVNA